MNRAERRKQEKLAKSSIKQLAKKPVCHLHETYSEEQITKTKNEIKEFLKTYDFKGSNYEDLVEEAKLQKDIYQGNHIAGVAIRLNKDFSVMEAKTGKVITTDIFLVKNEKGWFLSYENLNFQQNLLVSIHELGMDKVMSNREDILGGVRGHIIPLFNQVVRQAFDSLTLKYDEKWVA